MRVVIEYNHVCFVKDGKRLNMLREVDNILNCWKKLKECSPAKNYFYKMTRLCYGREWQPRLKSSLDGRLLTVYVNEYEDIRAKYADYGQSE